MTQEEQEKAIEAENLRERLEHRDVLLNLGVLLKTDSGRNFIKYLYKHFVGGVPPIGMEGVELADNLGIMRVGESIFKLVCEADFKMSAEILSEIERDRYEVILQQSQA